MVEVQWCPHTYHIAYGVGKDRQNSIYLNAPTHSWPSLWKESPGDVNPNFGLPLIPKYFIINQLKSMQINKNQCLYDI